MTSSGPVVGGKPGFVGGAPPKRLISVPVKFLSDEQVGAYGRFDGVPSRAELERFLLPADADRRRVDPHRGAHDRLGYALQAGTVRFLGPGTSMSDRALSPRGCPWWDRLRSLGGHNRSIAGCDVLGWVGVTVDVPLRLVTQAALQLLGVVARLGCQREPEGMPEVVGAQRADVAGGIGLFTVVPARSVRRLS